MNVIVKDETPFFKFKKEEFLEMFDKSLHRAYVQYTMKRQEKGDSWNDESVTSMLFLSAGLKRGLKQYLECPEHERFNKICDIINFALMLGEREYAEMFEKWSTSVKGIR